MKLDQYTWQNALKYFQCYKKWDCALYEFTCPTWQHCKALSVLEESAFVLPSAPTWTITWQHVLQGWQLLGEGCKSDLDTGLVETCWKYIFGLMWFKQFSESNKIEHTRYYKMILCMKTQLFHTQVQICGRKCFGIVATPPHRWSKRGKIIILYC